MKEKGQGSPEGEPKSQSKPNQPEQLPHGGVGAGPDRTSLPSVWHILERHMKLCAPARGEPPMSKKKYVREARKVKRLKDEIEEKGTDREKLIYALFDLDERNFMSPLPADVLDLLGTDNRSIFLEKLQEFRSRVEPMSDEEIGERIGQLKQLEKAHKRSNDSK